MSSKSPTHNLNIHMYNLEEILGLFDLTHNIHTDDLKRAKKKVLMLHPDKSRLGPEYFLFYKKAFDIVVQFYESQNRQNQKITENTTKYVPEETASWNKTANKQINKVIDGMSKEAFHAKFNQLFEQNMGKDMGISKKAEANAWFTKNDPLYQMEENVSANTMGSALDRIKQQTNGIALYRGVQTLSSSARTGADNLYEDDNNSDYVTSDPFSKLKYDDLRKVHKDQTVFAVSERDFAKVQTYASVDQFNRVRGQQDLTPLDKTQAQQQLDIRESQLKEQIMKKEYEAKLQTMKYAEKNKSVLSSFLQLM